jgi:hypothetical protein
MLLLITRFGIAQSYINTSNSDIKEIYNRIIDPEDFRPEILNKLIMLYVNTYRDKEKLDTFSIEPILKNASDDQAKYMAGILTATLDGEGKKKTTSSRLIYYGGSGIGEELVIKMPISKGAEYFSYGKVADDIGFKWVSDKKALELLQSTRFVLAGLGSSIDVDKKKVYTSLTLSNYTLFNLGAVHRNELTVPYTTKKYGLKKYDTKICHRCDKFRNIENLQRGLYVKDNNIYFKCDNFKQLKKILKDPTDGIAIDVIQRSQYECNQSNIVDFRLVNKGILLKRLKPSTLEKKNMIQDPKEQKKKVDIFIGPLPKGISDDYELNLLVIIDKHICKVITPSFEDEAAVEFTKEIELLADTILINAPDYTPIVEKAHLEFVIPFERNKSDYKPEDIEPLINKLNEPDFVINKLTIEAYSSVEGTNETNKELQKKRAESIVEALKDRQKVKFFTNIITADNIEDFKKDIQGTAWAQLANMDVKQIQDYIAKNKLEDKLEPILEKHRYARIKMDITYKLDPENEEKYVVNRFNKCIKENNLIQALAIQKYIFKKVLSKKFDKDAVQGQEIPEKPEYAGLLLNKLWLSGLLMNKLWLEKYVNKDELGEDYCQRIAQLYLLAPDNFYIHYNHCYCKILFDEFNTDKQITDFQKEITGLYSSGLKRRTVDLLNLEYQFKIIQILDTLDEPSPLLQASLDTIKSISKLTESNWQNSLKLSYIFMGQKDYEFAAKLIEPYITKNNVFDELIFSYLGICSHMPHKFSSPKFTLVVQKAVELDSKRFCQLYRKKKLSIQSLENPAVKEIYCKTCK